VRVTDSGTSFSDLHAIVQAWHPMQRVWSMTLIHVGVEAGAPSRVAGEGSTPPANPADASAIEGP
jgi:hypothetical protein